MSYSIEYHEKVFDDIRKLKLTKKQLSKLKRKIESIAMNPFPKSLGGLGEPLHGKLKGLLKFRFIDDYRVVYKIFREKDVLKIIIIGMRKDLSVYKKVKDRI
ncbi:MAG: type II toxin-antitoxin system mRNA interferase toxin, RelE/StbE family [Clostridiales bacterium]|nr:type II toxin-antitoxin system mRNA interferase toxin, RelE/StbE family [Clostridiales bacterium]